MSLRFNFAAPLYLIIALKRIITPAIRIINGSNAMSRFENKLPKPATPPRHFKNITVAINEITKIPIKGNRFVLLLAKRANRPSFEKEIIIYKTVVIAAIIAQVIIKYFNSLKKFPLDVAAKYIVTTAAMNNNIE